MREDIRLLIELQKIDSAIIEKKAIIYSLPAKLLSSENALKEIQSLYDKEKQKCEQVDKKKRDKERDVEDMNERIKKSKTRASEIKTNKEYQAHLKEVETLEKERYSVEDEILSLMEALEAAHRESNSVEIKMKAEKSKLDIFKKEVDKEIAEAEKELTVLKARRADLAGVVDLEIYNEYMTILKACYGLAVVEAKDEVCQGCNMNIPPQMFVEIKKNEEVMRCPQCRRILYWKENNE